MCPFTFSSGRRNQFRLQTNLYGKRLVEKDDGRLLVKLIYIIKPQATLTE